MEVMFWNVPRHYILALAFLAPLTGTRVRDESAGSLKNRASFRLIPFYFERSRRRMPSWLLSQTIKHKHPATEWLLQPYIGLDVLLCFPASDG